MRIKMIKIPVVIAFTALLTLGMRSGFAQDPLPALGEFHFNGDEITLPLNLQTGHPRVTAWLGDGEEYSFIVDTGASLNVIDSAVAEKNGYEVIGEMEIGAPGGPQVPGKIVRVPHVRLGDAEIRDAEFVTMDFEDFSGGISQGVLGFGVFRDYLLTFDLGQSEIRVSRARLSEEGPGVMPYEVGEGHIFVDIDVAGTTVKSHIDTGSMGEFVLPAEMLESLPVQQLTNSGATARLVGGDRDIRFAQLQGDIRFAGETYENPTLAFLDPSPGYGNVGSGIFRQFVMAIDQQNRLISFRKTAEEAATAASGQPRRLGVMFRGLGGGELTVATVIPGSLAESAGFKEGDTLKAVNGKPMDSIEMPELGQLIQGSEPLRFEVERGGDLVTIHID